MLAQGLDFLAGDSVSSTALPPDPFPDNCRRPGPGVCDQFVDDPVPESDVETDTRARQPGGLAGCPG